MGSLELDAPPDLDAHPSVVPHWMFGVLLLLAAIERLFGVGLDTTEISRAHTFADIAAAVERARGRALIVRPA